METGMNRETISPAEAHEALAAVDATRMELAAVANCPPWRHAAFGAVMGLLIGGAGFPTPVQTATLVLAMGGVAAIAANDRKRYGMFVNGFRRGATLPLTVLLMLAMLALLVTQIRLREEGVAAWVPLALGLAAFAVGTGSSVVWSRIFRREMGRRA
jgi:hypothetical protein